MTHNFQSTPKNKVLAEELSNLLYSSLSSFLNELSIKLEQDSIADKKRERPQLSKELKEAADHIYEAKKSIDKAWKISEPYMPKF